MAPLGRPVDPGRVGLERLGVVIERRRHDRRGGTSHFLLEAEKAGLRIVESEADAQRRLGGDRERLRMAARIDQRTRTPCIEQDVAEHVPARRVLIGTEIAPARIAPKKNSMNSTRLPTTMPTRSPGAI